MTSKYRVQATRFRYGNGWYYQVPSLTNRSVLFAAASWHKVVVYAMCRTAGCLHKDAMNMARRATPDFRSY